MLVSLHIENIAVMKSCDISFSPGFTALTGETGAGKSIIIDSIGLLCGARTDRSVIRNGEDRAEVCGFFCDIHPNAVKICSESGISADDGELMLSRAVSSDGRSVCRINGRQVPLSVFKEIASSLINIHGQQDNWSLLNENNHLFLLDKYADDGDAVAAYRDAYSAYSSKKNDLDKIIEQVERDAEERDVLAFFEKQGAELESLSALDTENVERMVHVMPILTVVREDVVVKKFTREELQAGAPETMDGYWQVPRLVE